MTIVTFNIITIDATSLSAYSATPAWLQIYHGLLAS
jgi:hypothetical protein